MITSRDNAKVKRWAKLVKDARARREEGRVLVEGPHLVAEALAAGLQPIALLVSEAGLKREDVQELVARREPIVLSDAVFRAIADVESPQGVGAEIAIPRIEAKGHGVFLEGIQDPSNVGAIVRSAAAFGVGEVVLDRSCADAWSAKSLRAGMGGHFKLGIRQVEDLGKALETFEGLVICTEGKGGTDLRRADLSGRLGWIFGSEGHGLSAAIRRRASLAITIPMAAGTESLNVAAAAAICLYEAYRSTANRPAAGS